MFSSDFCSWVVAGTKASHGWSGHHHGVNGDEIIHVRQYAQVIVDEKNGCYIILRILIVQYGRDLGDV